MALSEHSDNKYNDIPEFIPSQSSDKIPPFTFKKLSYPMFFALISGLTHGLNSFMAGTILTSLFENSETPSLGDMIENPFGTLSPLAWCVGSVFGFCAFFTNHAQCLDYVPKMKNDLLSIQILKQPISKNKKIALASAGGLALTSAAINAIFAWDTYYSLKNPWIRYSLSTTSAFVSFVITFAVRFVRTKEKFEEQAFFYTPEEYFLLQLIKDLKKKHHQNRHRDEDLGRPMQETPYIAELITIFKQRNILMLDRDELEETLSEIIKDKNIPPNHFRDIFRIFYIVICTFVGAEVFGEKAASKLPGDETGILRILRLFTGMGLSLSHIITYFTAASIIFDVMAYSFQTSPKKTLIGSFINLGAAPSMLNYCLSVANDLKHPPIFPFLQKNLVLKYIFGFFAFLDSFNLNFDSWANKFILPPPSPLEKDLQTLRKAIVEEHPVRQRFEYSEASRTLQARFFKPRENRQEKPGCWKRFRRFTGF